MPERPRRLDKYLCEATPMSLAQVRVAWAQGRVGVVCAGSEARRSELGELVFAEDVVLLDGAPVRLRTVHEHAILHKPPDVVSTARDPEGRADLSRWLRQMPSGMFPVGRLDRETTGLLLFTTDSDLQQAVLRPDQHTPKTYWLWIDEPMARDDPRLTALTRGLALQGHTFRAESVRWLASTAHVTELVVTLTQGKNRQIRKMCRAVGLRLVHLHRRTIGLLRLGDLPPGAWRLLAEHEIEELWAALGGRERQHSEKVAALIHQAERSRASGAPLGRLEAWLSRHAGAPVRREPELGAPRRAQPQGASTPGRSVP
jgi:23S rRNA pseudouridine2605 synthase